MGHVRDTIFSLVVTGFGAICYTTGRLGDMSMRNPVAMLAVLGMVMGWLAVLAGGIGWRRTGGPSA